LAGNGKTRERRERRQDKGSGAGHKILSQVVNPMARLPLSSLVLSLLLSYLDSLVLSSLLRSKPSHAKNRPIKYILFIYRMLWWAEVIGSGRCSSERKKRTQEENEIISLDFYLFSSCFLFILLPFFPLFFSFLFLTSTSFSLPEIERERTKGRMMEEG